MDGMGRSGTPPSGPMPGAMPPASLPGTIPPMSSMTPPYMMPGQPPSQSSQFLPMQSDPLPPTSQMPSPPSSMSPPEGVPLSSTHMMSPGGDPVMQGFYVPLHYHWFYCKNIELQQIWHPFTITDSNILEDVFRSGMSF